MILNGVLRQFAAWFRAGVGLGVMLFVAFTTLSALDQGADGLQRAAEPAYVPRPAVLVAKERDDYSVIRERNRFVADLVSQLSRTVSRLAR